MQLSFFDDPWTEIIADIKPLLVDHHAISLVDPNRRLDALDMLPFAMLSHRTANDNATAAFYNLRHYGDWPAVARALRRDVEWQIRMTTWPELKAPRLQAALRYLEYLRRGKMDLDNLRQMNTNDAAAWLRQFLGVGRKTANAVLLFSSEHRPIFPVDTACKRMFIRMGLFSPTVIADEANVRMNEVIPSTWTADDFELLHDGIKRHTHTVCTAIDPKCGNCILRDRCRHGRLLLR